MSYAADGYGYPEMADGMAVPIDSAPRPSAVTTLLFFIPVALSALGYIAGGMQTLTDFSFLVLSGLCLGGLLRELWLFPKRQGIGALLIYGGVLVWFCHDYFFYWFGANFNDPSIPFSREVIAKTAFYHCLFVAIMVAVFRYPIFRWADKFIVSVPEPSTDSVFFLALLLAMMVTISPFFLFVAESPFLALGKTLILEGNGVNWTVHRSYVGHATNLNYDWGGYIALVLEFGTLVGVLGAAYAIMIARSFPGRVFGWACWVFWVAYSYPTLRRGDLAFVCMPVAAFLYYKYQGPTLDYLRRSPWKAYILGGSAIGILFVAVQYEGFLRSNDTSLHVFDPRGNTMFSEGLKAWAYFPEGNGGHYYNETFPGADLIRPIPEAIFWFLSDPIPRAIWNDKPLPPIALWYSNFITGERTGVNGTTVSSGAVGAWYFQYGPLGVIQGALIYGWLMGVAERALRRANGRPMGVIFAFAFATFMFRAYRDLWWHALDPVLIAGLALYVIVRVFDSPRHNPSMEPAI